MDRLTTSKLLLFFLQVKFAVTYLEVTLTDVKPMVPNDHKFINFDNLKIRRENKTEHVIFGSIEVFVELSNEFEVKKYFNRSTLLVKIYVTFKNIFAVCSFVLPKGRECLQEDCIPLRARKILRLLDEEDPSL